MNGYLDIHSHIIPGVDDGSRDMDMTMQMVTRAYEEGIRYMMATPHFYPGHKNADAKKIEDVFSEVKKNVQSRFPDVELMLGNEIYYKDEALDLLQKKEIHTLNGSRYILVEFNVGLEYKKIYEAIKRFTMRGYYPIIAHVERYVALFKHEDLIKELVDTGAYIQVNAETFMGGIFDPYKKFCLGLADKGLVHFLGSDAHNNNNRRPIMEQAVNVLRKKIDSEVLEKILVYNPEHFLKNEFI